MILKKRQTLAVFTTFEVALALANKYPERMRKVLEDKQDFYIYMGRDGLVMER